MTTDIIATVVSFALGIICLILHHSAVKKEKSHRYGKNFLDDINIAMGVIIAPFAAIAGFVLAIIGLIIILCTKS